MRKRRRNACGECPGRYKVERIPQIALPKDLVAAPERTTTAASKQRNAVLIIEVNEQTIHRPGKLYHVVAVGRAAGVLRLNALSRL